ncbi:MAG: hypothetical protein U0793_29375 [Gemmataceae bacterium]
MPSGELQLQQPPLLDRKQVDCVEVYVPKSIEFLSELYQMLRDKTRNRLGNVVLDGFSIYEVDGVFHGEVLWEQRTLVIRILLVRKAATPTDLLEATVFELGREIATRVAIREEQIWICHYAQNLRVFTGLKRMVS